MMCEGVEDLSFCVLKIVSDPGREGKVKYRSLQGLTAQTWRASHRGVFQMQSVDLLTVCYHCHRHLLALHRS